jgi:hypothetical protein
VSNLLPQERIALKDFLTERFSIGELEDIVFNLGLSHESFPHDTREHFARELYLHCERRSILGYLVVEILRRRMDAQQRFGGLIEKLEFSSPRKKVQIILLIDEPTISKERVQETISQSLRQVFPNVLPEDIVILATAPDSGRALVGLPTEAANMLIQSTSHELPSPIHQAVDFESLSLECQKDWKSLVVTLKSGRTQVIAKAGHFVVQETIYEQIRPEDTSHK